MARRVSSPFALFMTSLTLTRAGGGLGNATRAPWDSKAAGKGKGPKGAGKGTAAKMEAVQADNAACMADNLARATQGNQGSFSGQGFQQADRQEPKTNGECEFSAGYER